MVMKRRLVTLLDIVVAIRLANEAILLYQQIL